jgi:hypothetical protein
MKQLALLGLLVALMLLPAGCDLQPDLPADPTLPPAPTVVATPEAALPTVAPVTDTAPAATIPPADESPTDEPSTVELPTDELPTDESPTEEPSTEEPPTVELPTAEPTATVLFGPGQQTTNSLEIDGSNTYLFQGTPFQSVVMFVEPVNELNVGLAAYTGDVTGQTTPEGLTPLAAADNALAGRPEIMVLTTDADGFYTFVVRAVSGQGSYTAYLFDLTTPATGMAVQQPDSLEAGQERTYTVTSEGTRPVIAIADPSDQSDIALDVLGVDEELLTSANFSGPGGVETAYVLPLGVTSYTIQIREVNDGPSTFNVAIITLE